MDGLVLFQVKLAKTPYLRPKRVLQFMAVTLKEIIQPLQVQLDC